MITNHLAGHKELHSKYLLYGHIKRTRGKNAFKHIMPTYTYHGREKEQFINHFRYLNNEDVPITAEILSTPRESNSENIWILKPEILNRGRGIAIARTLETIDAHLHCMNDQLIK